MLSINFPTQKEIEATEHIIKKNLLNETAELAAADAAPRTYRLLNSLVAAAQPSQIKFLTIGCQGNGKKAQQAVSDLMLEISKHPYEKPDFILILGDNFYDWGINSPQDADVENHFNHIFAKFKKMGIPCFVILGNHDENFHKFGKLQSEQGVKRALHQVAISYLPDSTYPNTEAKKTLYSQENLVLDQLPLWNMPHRFYSLIKGDTEIFCIDSNTYVNDYLEYLTKKEETPDSNQAKWLVQQLNQAKRDGRKTILAMHHPIATPGKRAYHNDMGQYFSKQEKLAVKQHFNLDHNVSYNTLLKACFAEQGLNFDLFLAAHDHAIYYYNNNEVQPVLPNNEIKASVSSSMQNLERKINDYKVCQVTSGGGGGSLQNRVYFDEQQNMGCYYKKHGLVAVRRTDAGFNISICPLDKKNQLEFSHTSLDALRIYPNRLSAEECARIKRLCETVNRAINTYFKFLASEQKKSKGEFFTKTPVKGNISHGFDGVNRVHELWAYINNHEADDYLTTLNEIYHKARWDQTFVKKFFTHPSDHSFIITLEKELSKEYVELGEKLTLQTFYKHETHPKASSFQSAKEGKDGKEEIPLNTRSMK